MSIEDKGLRKNEGKTQWSLMDFESHEEMIEVLTFGLKKYSRDNWKKGGDNFKLSKICESLSRHLFAYMDGEEFDPETGKCHIAHIQANAMFIQYHRKHNPELNDLTNKKENE